MSTKDLNTSVENEVLGVSHIFPLPMFHGTGSNLQHRTNGFIGKITIYIKNTLAFALLFLNTFSKVHFLMIF